MQSNSEISTTEQFKRKMRTETKTSITEDIIADKTNVTGRKRS